MEINGNIIKSEIYKKGYSIKEIANILNISDMTISNWINGRNLNQIEKFINLMLLLDIDIKEVKG